MAYGLKLVGGRGVVNPLTVGDGCWMVEVRTSLGTEDFSGDEVAGRGIGVMGAGGLGSVLMVAKEGLYAGVCGEGAARET